MGAAARTVAPILVELELRREAERLRTQEHRLILHPRVHAAARSMGLVA